MAMAFVRRYPISSIIALIMLIDPHSIASSSSSSNESSTVDQIEIGSNENEQFSPRTYHIREPENVDPEEYERFLESMFATQRARFRFFQRVNITTTQHHHHAMFRKPSVDDLLMRKFDYQTGVQFEDEFDCDMNQLARCESSMLAKVRAIETSDGEQEDVLTVCRSIDEEFNCLLQYALKCERKIGADAFAVLAYIAQQSNETIISCETKQNDWLGFDVGKEDDDATEWMDDDGEWHYHARREYHQKPCINATTIAECFDESFGRLPESFDPPHDTIRDRAHCDALAHFDRCLKRAIFEIDPDRCLMEEKEMTLDILRGMFVFTLPELEQSTEDRNLVNSVVGYLRNDELASCRAMRDHWSQTISAKRRAKARHEDNAERLTETLRSSYQALKSLDCHRKTLADDELCLSRFEHRIRALWANEIAGQLQFEDEIQRMCCYTAELTACQAIFVLIRCGLDPFKDFKQKVEFARLNSLPDECVHLPYDANRCQAILHT